MRPDAILSSAIAEKSHAVTSIATTEAILVSRGRK
jgi:hypothetical protein